MATFGPDELREKSRANFVDNETDTDEYGETQPEKGENYLAAALLLAIHPATVQALHAHAEKWRAAYATGGRYDGADELRPILDIYHDLLWERGEHPYYSEISELIDFINDTED